MDTGKLTKALIIGAVLAAGAIFLFLGLFLYILAGLPAAARLIGSFIVPIVVIGVVIFGYYLVTKRKSKE